MLLESQSGVFFICMINITKHRDYDEAKRMIKSGTEATGTFSEKDEADFMIFLQHELEKVCTFQSARAKELMQTIEECEKAMIKLLKRLKSDSDPRLELLKQEMARITEDITELSRYMRMNYSGFIKILKKHDKYTSFKSKPMFMVQLESKPFYKEDFDALIIRMSMLYEMSRSGGKEKTVTAAGTSSQSFIRRTTKYWVHPENVTEVKCIILKHLPVLVFSSKDGKDPDPAISSIYFDNDSFELYQGRLEKSEGAEAIRLRWYGDMSQTEVFVERKTHREDWTGESSVKARFPMKEKYVNGYLKGTYTMEKSISKLRDRHVKTEKELEEMDQLSSDVQATILNKNLHPMVRTFYNRTAFQLPGDARVRISLDTDLTMIREDNEKALRSGDNWRRMDVGTKPPFNHIDPEDVCNFPYAILEVKLQTQHGTQAPVWVEELVKSHLVEEVPKFSKFIHGVATLLDHRVSLLPFWLPQMDKDIRKAPAEGYLSQASENEMIAESSSKGKQREQIQITVPSDIEVNTEGEDETEPLLGTSSKKKISKSMLRKIFTSWNPTAATHGNSNSTGPSNNKRIVLPVRIEPKVFFANERTFLSWLHFCIVLGGLALGLLNFGDRVGQISGIIFTIVAMMFIIYALMLYQWRAQQIRNRHPGPYDDRIGPTVLVAALFFAILTNFYLKFTSPNAGWK